MAGRKTATYCLVSIEMNEHKLCDVRVKGGQREVDVVRHGELGACSYGGSVWSRKEWSRDALWRSCVEPLRSAHAGKHAPRNAGVGETTMMSESEP